MERKPPPSQDSKHKRQQQQSTQPARPGALSKDRPANNTPGQQGINLPKNPPQQQR